VIISVPYREKLEANTISAPLALPLNYDLHLRNFDDEKMKQLMNNGFSHVESHHLGPMVSFKGHYAF